MVIPIDSLRSLPEGAAYVERKGQATAKVQREGNRLVVTANCDSLQQVIFNLLEELHRARDETEQVQIEEKPAQSPFKWYLYGCLTGLVAMAILVVIIKKKE